MKPLTWLLLGLYGAVIAVTGSFFGSEYLGGLFGITGGVVLALSAVGWVNAQLLRQQRLLEEVLNRSIAVERAIAPHWQLALGEDLHVETTAGGAGLPEKALRFVGSSQRVRIAVSTLDAFLRLSVVETGQPNEWLRAHATEVFLGVPRDNSSGDRELLEAHVKHWMNAVQRSGVSPIFLAPIQFPMTVIETDEATILALPPTRDDIPDTLVLTLRRDGPFGRSMARYLDELRDSHIAIQLGDRHAS